MISLKKISLLGFVDPSGQNACWIKKRIQKQKEKKKSISDLNNMWLSLTQILFGFMKRN